MRRARTSAARSAELVLAARDAEITDPRFTRAEGPTRVTRRAVVAIVACRTHSRSPCARAPGLGESAAIIDRAGLTVVAERADYARRILEGPPSRVAFGARYARRSCAHAEPIQRPVRVAPDITLCQIGLTAAHDVGIEGQICGAERRALPGQAPFRRLAIAAVGHVLYAGAVDTSRPVAGAVGRLPAALGRGPARWKVEAREKQAPSGTVALVARAALVLVARVADLRVGPRWVPSERGGVLDAGACAVANRICAPRRVLAATARSTHRSKAEIKGLS